MKTPLASTVLGLVLAAAAISGAHASPPAVASSQAMKALTGCRNVPDPTARLQCYDAAAAAFETAQSRGDVVVVDREQVRSVRRQAFGLAIPSLNIFPHGKDETPDRITLVLARAYAMGDGRWRMISEEGAEWSQTEMEQLFATPHAGSHVEVRRGAMNGYFCKVDGQSAFRCRRET